MQSGPEIPVSDRPKVTPEHVDTVFSACKFDDKRAGKKTTVVCMTLPNGFEVVESSSCVDPANYDHSLGIDICMRRLKDRLWYLLGFELQCLVARTDGAPA